MTFRLIPVLAALALAGCAIGPDYVRPESPLPAGYNYSRGDEASAGMVAAQWWTQFGDPALNDLVDQALNHNGDLRHSVALVEQAEAEARETHASLFPEIDAAGNVNHTKASTRTATYFSSIPRYRMDRSLGLSTSYEIDLWGRVRRANEAARASLLASSYARDAVRLSVAGMVASNYLSLRASDALIAVLDDSVGSRRESLRLVKIRLAAGYSPPLEQAQAEGALAAAEGQLADQRRLRALAEHQLALLTGNPALRVVPGDLRRLPLPPEPPAGLPSQLVEARPDVRQAEQLLVAANANIGLAKAAYFPSFSLTAGVGVESAALANLFGAGAGTSSLALGIAGPLLDFGRTAARVDRARALDKQALITWENTLQTAYKEVRDALVSLREEGAAENAQNGRVTSTRRAFELATAQHKAGRIAYLEVLDAQRSLNDALTARISARQARLTAAVDLFKALGGGWQADGDPQS